MWSVIIPIPTPQPPFLFYSSSRPITGAWPIVPRLAICQWQWGSQDLSTMGVNPNQTMWGGEGGGTYRVFFIGPPPASKVAQVQLRKLMMSGGGGGTFFFLLQHFGSIFQTRGRGILVHHNTAPESSHEKRVFIPSFRWIIIQPQNRGEIDIWYYAPPPWKFVGEHAPPPPLTPMLSTEGQWPNVRDQNDRPGGGCGRGMSPHGSAIFFFPHIRWRICV